MDLISSPYSVVDEMCKVKGSWMWNFGPYYRWIPNNPIENSFWSTYVFVSFLFVELDEAVQKYAWHDVNRNGNISYASYTDQTYFKRFVKKGIQNNWKWGDEKRNSFSSTHYYSLTIYWGSNIIINYAHCLYNIGNIVFRATFWVFLEKQFWVSGQSDASQWTKKLQLQDLSVYFNYNSANEYILFPVQSDVTITKSKNALPLTGDDPRKWFTTRKIT